MIAPVHQTHYFNAVTNLRALADMNVADHDDFSRRSEAFAASLELIGLTPGQVSEVRRLNQNTLEANEGRAIPKPFLNSYFGDLKRAGVFPKSRREPHETTLAGLTALITGGSQLFNAHAASSHNTNFGDLSSPDAGRNAVRGASALRQESSPPPAPVSGPGPVSVPVAPASVSVPAAKPTPPDPEPVVLADPFSAHPRLIVLEQLHGTGQYEPVVSQYEISPRELGGGAFGTVYEGRDSDTGMKVAIKIITIEDPTQRAQFLQLFQNERQFQGRIDSDEIVRIYKTGLTGDGKPYIVMELLTGGTMFKMMQETHARPLMIKMNELKHVGAMAISAVCAAHRHGVLHKDIKPENLLFSEGRLKLKLSDFGISQLTKDAQANGNGTLGYIPPESLNGTAETVQRDVFALGVVLYLLYAYRKPFDDSTVAACYKDMLERVPAPPSELRPDLKIPPEVDRIILKALAPDPAQRYATAEDLLFDFVTSEVQAQMERIEQLRQEIEDKTNDPDNLQRLRLWIQMMRDAIRKLEHIELRYPSDRIRQTRLNLLEALHDHADRVGYESLLQETADNISLLDTMNPRLDENAGAARVMLEYDDPHMLMRRTKPTFTIANFTDRAGVIQLTGVDKLPLLGRVMDFHRGTLQGISVRGQGIHPVFIPLPVRPGGHKVTIPIYPANEIPPGGLLIPRGEIPSRNRFGSYSEAINPGDLRRVNHDFVIGNLVSNREYWEFLGHLHQAGRNDDVHARKPATWTFTATQVLGPDGRPIGLDEPVRDISVEDMRAYLETMRPGTRFPTMNEQKRAGRGNDARCFSWGDSPAYKPGMAAYQFVGSEPSLSPMDVVPSDPFFGDRSPFSVPTETGKGFEAAVYHLTGNVTEVLSLGTTAEERAPILGAFSVTRGKDPNDDRLSDQFFVTYGLPYNSPPPTNSDIIGLEKANGKKVPYGFRWVKPLRPGK